MFILDVRPYALKEFPYSLPNSINCPLIFLHKVYDKLPKDREIVLVDPYMKQSPTAAKFLVLKGYKVAGALKGGLNVWKKMKLPMLENAEMQSLADYRADPY